MKNYFAILLVEDDPGDVELTRLHFEESAVPTRLTVAVDGVAALACLHGDGLDDPANRPDLILLDLNMPRKDGREVLSEIKRDRALKSIPVVVFTTSDARDDIEKCYELGANSYLTKPAGLNDYARTIALIEEYWLKSAKLPGRMAS